MCCVGRRERECHPHDPQRECARALWVAEMMEGNETQVAMVHVDASTTSDRPGNAWCCAARRLQGSSSDRRSWYATIPFWRRAEINGHFLVIYPDRISILFEQPASGEKRTRS